MEKDNLIPVAKLTINMTVELNIAKVEVASSNLVSRSIPLSSSNVWEAFI